MCQNVFENHLFCVCVCNQWEIVQQLTEEGKKELKIIPKRIESVLKQQLKDEERIKIIAGDQRIYENNRKLITNSLFYWMV